MSQPSTETRKGLDGLVMACLIAASVLVIATLASAPLSATLAVLAVTLTLLFLYLRAPLITKDSPAPNLSGLDVTTIREKAFLSLADSFPRAVAVLDRNGDVLHANEAAKTLLSPDMVNRPAAAYLRSSELRPRLEQAFAGEPVPALKVHVMAPTERIVDVDFSAPVSTKSEKVRGDVIFAVIADRTEASLAREKQADFLANASHELKTPIASLKGYIETLRGHAKDDPKAREMFLGIMQDQADRMERLVTDLLSLRKIESSEHIAPSEQANLRGALETVHDVLKPLAAERGVLLTVSLPEQETAMISGKTDECVQLFLNLMENAIKLAPAKSTVTVTLDYLTEWTGEAFPAPVRQGAALRRIVNIAPFDSPAWRIIISDSGPGFSRAHLPRIGERFYRVAGDLPAQEKGTGLGLAIVKHVVMRHRAGLFVQSAHKDDPIYFGREAGTAIKESGTAFSVVFAASTPLNRETST